MNKHFRKFQHKKLLRFGLSYRTSDAIAAMAGVNYKNTFIGYSYDATVSPLRHYSSGSHEIVVGYNFVKGKKKEKTSK